MEAQVFGAEFGRCPGRLEERRFQRVLEGLEISWRVHSGDYVVEMDMRERVVEVKRSKFYDGRGPYTKFRLAAFIYCPTNNTKAA